MLQRVLKLATILSGNVSIDSDSGYMQTVRGHIIYSTRNPRKAWRLEREQVWWWGIGKRRDACPSCALFLPKAAGLGKVKDLMSLAWLAISGDAGSCFCVSSRSLREAEGRGQLVFVLAS
jgi:hypothetical protein